jgi:hypothetical protein
MSDRSNMKNILISQIDHMKNILISQIDHLNFKDGKIIRSTVVIRATHSTIVELIIKYIFNIVIYVYNLIYKKNITK